MSWIGWPNSIRPTKHESGFIRNTLSLNGERAIDLIHQGRADDVLRVIESLDESTYT